MALLSAGLVVMFSLSFAESQGNSKLYNYIIMLYMVLVAVLIVAVVPISYRLFASYSVSVNGSSAILETVQVLLTVVGP